MTVYFDEALQQTLELRHTPGQDDAYITAMAAIEEPVVRDVLLCTGDREFPDDLRQHALKTISLRAVALGIDMRPTAQARDYALTMHYSRAIEELHSLFHTLAMRSITTRFGHWTDSPRDNLDARRRHDEAAP
jgi:hypothetical protein